MKTNQLNFTLINVQQNINHAQLNLITDNKYDWNNHLIKQIGEQYVVNQATIVGKTLSGKTTTILPFYHLADIMKFNPIKFKAQTHNYGNIKCDFTFLVHDKENDVKLEYSFEKEEHKVIKERVVVNDGQLFIELDVKKQLVNSNLQYSDLILGLEQCVTDFNKSLKNVNLHSILFGSPYQEQSFIQKQIVENVEQIDLININYETFILILKEFKDFLTNHLYVIINGHAFENKYHETLENVSYYDLAVDLLFTQELQTEFNDFLNTIDIPTINFKQFNIHNDITDKEIENIISSLPTSLKTLIKYFYIIVKVNNEKNPQLIVIDDLDIGLNIQTIYKIARMIEEKYGQSCQRIFTLSSSFNVNLLGNHFNRPDCCYVVNLFNVKSLNRLTNRHLSQIHDIAHLYSANAFEE